MHRVIQYKMFNVFTKYIASNKILVIIGLYFLFSAILEITIGIDICIPCIWKLIFGLHCPGCGLTTAFISLIELDPNKAYKSNWLIFILIPFGIYYVAKDFNKFKGECK